MLDKVVLRSGTAAAKDLYSACEVMQELVKSRDVYIQKGEISLPVGSRFSDGALATLRNFLGSHWSVERDGFVLRIM